ncbi:Tetratricopeptide repeat-containing protein [Ekhidna lutea]|uniref:Tetratricopeptide repeat-containing protein n=1 Tax=Ekhidna lutea TaxID=447679 RepID=A0A239EBU5_EKHLU|nr:CHAT domain-containing protein [Ekhidna lutea]SNS42135.1 Tetratricopeptide repeat-containing protein [Ekhidna lutea]
MRLLYTIALTLVSVTLFAQYAFESKKAEKLYYKLDDAYLDYDYETILDNEAIAKETFLTKEDTVAANIYSYLAEAYDYELSDYQKALDFYQLELNLRKKIEPTSDVKDLLYNMATLQTELGYYTEAEQFLITIQEADAEEFGKESAEYFDSSRALIELYLQTEQVNKGLSEAESIRKEVAKKSVEEGVSYKWIGDAYAIEGSFKKAEKNILRGLSVFEENGLETTIEYVSTLNSLGVIYMDKGKLPEAEEIFQQAIDLVNRMQGENDDVIAGLQNNLAIVYFNLGDYERATALQRNILEEDKDYYGEDSFTYGLSLLNLGLTLLYDGQYTESEKLHLEAMQVFETSAGKESIDYGRVQNNLSLLNARRGRIDEAIDYGQKAIKTYEATLGEDHPETAFPYFNLANAHLGYEEVDKAKPLANRAYEIRKKALGDQHPYFARSANQLAIVNWKEGNNEEALKFYQETFDNYFNQINTFFPVLTEEEKATFYYTNLRPAFEQYVSFIEETSREDKDLLGEIYNYQLALKGLIMYATSKVRESILASGDENLISMFEEWISQKEQLAKLFSATDIEIGVRNKKIDSLTEASNVLEEQLSKSSQAFGENFANKSVTWEDIRNSLAPGEAAVEMVRYRDFSTDSSGVFTDEVYYAAMIVRHDTEDHPEMVILRNGAQMEQKFLANYRNAIKYKISENYSYRLFWQPIARRLEGINKIYFAPDGVYNQISIYTLQNPGTKDYLLNEIDLALVTNTKDLLEESQPFEDGGRSVFFGYPQYSMGSTLSDDGSAKDRGVRGARGSRGKTSKEELSRGIPRGVRGNLVRYMQSFNGLGMLPGTKKEVELIDSLYAVNDRNRDTYFLNEALEGTVKSVNNPNILHIATHGFFLEQDHDAQSDDAYVQNPLLRSGLILAGANNFIQTGTIVSESDGNDGILTAFEAMNMNLDKTDVVVLSACETGLGEIKNGEGVYGLQRAFQIAGADAIIMSMWTVDDDATQELMTTFYREWLSHGDKQLAFNTAQKKLREKYKKPYYWGAFVMIGE